MWHRDPDSGDLQPGDVDKTKCQARISTFIPYDLARYPFVVMVTWGQHLHAPPRRTKTPPIYLEFLDDYLRELDWKIATISARSLHTNDVIISRLRRDLEWTGKESPTLADLHISLSNNEHLGVFVDSRRMLQFPGGTGWDGTQLLKETQDLNYVEGDEEVYIRAMQKTDDFQFVLLMLPKMSRWLKDARHLCMDVSFKRVQGWKEFGIEAWSHDTAVCE